MATGHFPVMLEEAVDALAVERAGTVVDATFGGGGHTRRILEKIPPGGRVFGLDRDPHAAERASDLLRDRRFTFIAAPYDEALRELADQGVKVDAILFDLGLSSFQVDDPERGFSYVNDGPLDMRMDPDSGVSAAEFLNTAESREISRVLSELGDVPRREAARISRSVVSNRPLSTTLDLANAVREAVGWRERGGNPSKRVFQAVRIYINDEIGGLQRALDAAERLLVPGGRLVAITFHSGEDRVVKRFISDREGKCVCPPDLPVCVCGASPVFRRGGVFRPSPEELEKNRRSASARMRTAIRTSEPPTSDGEGI